MAAALALAALVVVWSLAIGIWLFDALRALALRRWGEVARCLVGFAAADLPSGVPNTASREDAELRTGIT